jgi:hypothetical protein
MMTDKYGVMSASGNLSEAFANGDPRAITDDNSGASKIRSNDVPTRLKCPCTVNSGDHLRVLLIVTHSLLAQQDPISAGNLVMQRADEGLVTRIELRQIEQTILRGVPHQG